MGVGKYKAATGYHWRVMWRDATGQQRTKRGFKTKRDAQTYERQVMAELAAGVTKPRDTKRTLDTFVPDWKVTHTNKKPATIAKANSTLNNYVLPTWGAYPVTKITEIGIQRWVDQLSQDLSASTIGNILTPLRDLLELAKKAGYIDHNPALGVKAPKRHKADVEPLTAEQVLALVNHTPDTYKLVVMLLATTGLRWGELIALRPKDVIGDNRLRITRSYSSQTGTFGATKTHENRTVTTTPEVYHWLREHMAGIDREELIWEAPQAGGPLKPPNGATHWFMAAVRRCQADDETFPRRFTVHGLRHTAASLMIRSGVNVKLVQRQLGHSSATITLDTYGHLYPDGLEEVSTLMSQILPWRDINLTSLHG